MAKIYKHYYYDSTSDDFANCKIVTKETPKHYEYLPKNNLNNILCASDSPNSSSFSDGSFIILLYFDIILSER